MVAIGTLSASAAAHADDRVDFTTTWFQEARDGGQGGLTVIHPQLDIGIDIGEHASLSGGYAADIVTGATAAVYSTDAVSTATPFDDFRNEGSLTLGFEGGRSSLSFTGGIGVERDYVSIVFGVGGEITLPGKNTTVGVSYAHNFDEVCDRENNEFLTPLERQPLTGLDPCNKTAVRTEDTEGMTVWRDLSIDTVSATVTQNFTPTTVGQLSIYGQVLEGFQANPYRRVRVGANEPRENVPDVRARGALTARLNRFIPKLRSAVHLTARGYSDTWGVNSGTFELGYSQYAGSSLLIHVHARVYRQSEATFFKDAFFYETESAAGAYFTGDRELGRLQHAIVGGKLTVFSVAEGDDKVWKLFDSLRLNLKSDIFILQELAADDTDANLAGRSRQFLNSGKFLDAFALQLGLLLAY